MTKPVPPPEPDRAAHTRSRTKVPKYEIAGNLFVLVVLAFLVVRGDFHGWLPVAVLVVLFMLFADTVRRSL